MTAQELREKYLDFFKSKGHTIIPSASLVPKETDSSVLFTTAGMHPLVPYLLGEDHPGGKRVANVQKCIRTGDIDDVGDNRHNTFFEMMGNWSFGDYFKKEAIEWSWEFLTDKKWLGLDPKRIYATVFKGEFGIPHDEDSIRFWRDTFQKSGIRAEVAGEDESIKNDIRIIPLDAENNFWIASATGPCGPDTEMFYDTRPEDGAINDTFANLVKSGRLIEIWNNVFMEFNKTADGKHEKLKQQNVDTGMGVERTLAVLNGKETVFETELFIPIFEKIKTISPKKYKQEPKSYRIIADHIKAAVFIISDGVIPSNTGQGYVVRRLVRRSVRYGKLIGMDDDFTKQIAEVVVEIYKSQYSELEKNKKKIYEELEKEENNFKKTLERGLGILNKLYPIGTKKLESGEIPPVINIDVDPEEVFNLYQTYGFPFEMIQEELGKRGFRAYEEEFNRRLKKHQDLSRTASAGMFKGGLSDAGEETARLHTATHLLLAALRQVLGEDIYQKGSNITAERLRFDFNYPQKLTPEQLKKVEDLVNDKIQENLPVEMTEMPKDEALKIAKVSLDPSKYGDIVKVYKTGAFSIEVCGGPHAENTEELGHFKITKEEASSAGVRRIKAVLTPH